MTTYFDCEPTMMCVYKNALNMTLKANVGSDPHERILEAVQKLLCIMESIPNDPFGGWAMSLKRSNMVVLHYQIRDKWYGLGMRGTPGNILRDTIRILKYICNYLEVVVAAEQGMLLPLPPSGTDLEDHWAFQLTRGNWLEVYQRLIDSLSQQTAKVV